MTSQRPANARGLDESMPGELMAEITHIPEDVRHELRADETPQWIGYPIPKQYAIQEGLTLFLFGIPWTAFVIFWESLAMKSGNLFFQL